MSFILRRCELLGRPAVIIEETLWFDTSDYFRLLLRQARCWLLCRCFIFGQRVGTYWSLRVGDFHYCLVVFLAYNACLIRLRHQSFFIFGWDSRLFEGVTWWFIGQSVHCQRLPAVNVLFLNYRKEIFSRWCRLCPLIASSQMLRQIRLFW